MVDLRKLPNYLRELETPLLPCPDPLNLEELSQYIEPGSPIITHTGDSYHLLRFNPDNQEIPLEVAEWLHFLTHVDDSIATYHEADRYRFDSIEDIRLKFLKGQGGRTLFVAVDSSERVVSGVGWSHVLQDDEKDFTLAKACVEEYLEGVPTINRLAANFATGAVRGYLRDRHRVEVSLMQTVTQDTLRRGANTIGVVTRLSLHDPLVQDINEVATVAADTYGRFTAIGEPESSSGVVIMLALRDEYNRPIWTSAKDSLDL